MWVEGLRMTLPASFLGDPRAASVLEIFVAHVQPVVRGKRTQMQWKHRSSRGLGEGCLSWGSSNLERAQFLEHGQFDEVNPLSCTITTPKDPVLQCNIILVVELYGKSPVTKSHSTHQTFDVHVVVSLRLLADSCIISFVFEAMLELVIGGVSVGVMAVAQVRKKGEEKDHVHIQLGSSSVRRPLAFPL